MAVNVRSVQPGGNLRDFLNVVDVVYDGDANFIRELDFDLAGRLSPKHPFFEHGEAILFTAYRDGRCVGRCSAQLDRLHLERYGDKTGFFGFADTIDDAEAARALIDAAREWLRSKGMKRMLGPFMLSINDQAGCLVEGFDTPPMFMMPHHRPYQGALLEQAGLAKCKDLYAWRYKVGELNRRAAAAHEAVMAMPEVKTRHMEVEHLERDVRIVMDVFNDAWQDNWNYVPFTEAELKKFANEFKLIVVPEITLITEIDGEPAAVAFAIPNLNEATRHLRGKLFPTGLFKLLWYTKVRRPKTARLIILGIRKKYRAMKQYGALSTFLYAEMNNCSRQVGIEWGELSFTLEDNHPINLGIRAMGGEIYKRYRMYECGLD
jgi:hypothetical protein